jgi:sugar phosphate permease
MTRALTRRPPLFYGWYIVGVALLAQFVAAGTQTYASGVFLKPMTQELHWSRESFSAVQTVSTVVMGGLGLVIGGIIDKRGPRLLMLFGAVIAGASLCATSQVHELWQFYLLRGVGQTVGNAMLGNLVVNVTVSKWFVARRGMAVAIASAGVSLGGVLMAPVVSIFVGAYGWRPAWILLGIVVWVLILPSALVIRRTPEDHGLLPDGMSLERAREYSVEKKRASSVSERQWTRPEALRTKTIWLVILAYGTANIGLGAMLLHLIPYLTDQGFDRGTAALLFSIQAWAALISKPLWGMLMDRFHARFLSAVGFMIAAGSILALIPVGRAGSEPLLAVVLAAYGFGIGGTIPLQETVWASYFGRQHLGKIRSVALPFSIVFGAGGPLLAGYLYDRTGSYTSAFVIFAFFSLIGFIFILLARPPRHPDARVEVTLGPLVPAAVPHLASPRGALKGQHPA